jgi:uncharacterized damage-inducible protein DinB
MIEMVKWIERQFHDRPDAGTFPMVAERLAGTPARIEEKARLVPDDMTSRNIGDTWSVREHIGHLRDLEPLWKVRIDEFLGGVPELTAADMTNRLTRDAGHNDRTPDELAGEFRTARAGMMERLEGLDETEILREALHPRLKVPMRLIDLCTFVAEHDDHHLARISELWRALAGKPSVLALDPRFR